jgi:diguanylate cyclase (GGDEF)-like protein
MYKKYKGTDDMNYLIQFQVNLFALASLGILFYVIYKKTLSFNYSKRLLMYIVIVNAIALVIEPLTWIFDNKHFFGAFFLEYSTNFILYLLVPVLAGLIASYVDYKIFNSKKRLKTRYYYQHASAIVFLLLIINIFIPFIFSVDASINQYSSGNYYWINYILVVIFYIYMLSILLKNAHKINRQMRYILILFFFLPIIGIVVQSIESNLHFSWTSVVLSLFMVYAFLESISGDIDYLTKLFSRYSYGIYIKSLIEEEKHFGILFVDLNGFKSINDRYGHQLGDDVLVEFSSLLKKAFYLENMVARIGGDEFIVVIEKDEKNLKINIENCLSSMKHSNLKIVNELTFAFGYQKYEKHMTSDVILDLADKKMYENKNK